MRVGARKGDTYRVIRNGGGDQVCVCLVVEVGVEGEVEVTLEVGDALSEGSRNWGDARSDKGKWRSVRR